MKIFLIGPGGVGKTTCGEILANLLNCNFIDLDREFCNQIDNVGDYIKNNGYENYCLENSKLFYNILSRNTDNFVFSLSSGFLVHENFDELTLKHKQALKDCGISILLLPSESLEESIEIVIKRQLSRGFNLNEDKERAKFIKRFLLYRDLGDIKIFSKEEPKVVVKLIKEQVKKYNLRNWYRFRWLPAPFYLLI